MRETKRAGRFGAAARALWVGLIACLSGLALAGAANAQDDICGCVGHPDSLGAFDARDLATYPPGWVLAGTIITAPLPEDGILVFDSFRLDSTPQSSRPSLRFTPNAKNTPVTILVAGDFLIQRGTINLDGASGESTGTVTNAVRVARGGAGGPGGYRGGDGGFHAAAATGLGGAGFGPGGGAPGDVSISSPVSGVAGTWVGASDLLPVTGGSGGGGGSTVSTGSTCANGAGGGGGGAILVAANGTLTLNDSITARGGSGGFNSFIGCAAGGGNGAGGSIRLVATTIQGGARLDAGSSATGSEGRVRLEAFSNTRTNSNTVPAPSRALEPGPIALIGADAEVAITAIAGTGIPQPPTGWRGGIDLQLPLPQTVTVQVETQNVPADTFVDVTLKPRVGGAPTVTSVAIDAASCDAGGSCVVFTDFDLPAGSYAVEAEATLVPSAPL